MYREVYSEILSTVITSLTLQSKISQIFIMTIIETTSFFPIFASVDVDISALTLTGLTYRSNTNEGLGFTMSLFQADQVSFVRIFNFLYFYHVTSCPSGAINSIWTILLLFAFAVVIVPQFGHLTRTNPFSSLKPTRG